MNIVKRAAAPTPKFFRILRNVGLILAAIGGGIMTAPVSLPVGLVTAGGYIVVAGGVLSAVSQVTVDDNALKVREKFVQDHGK